MRRSITMILVLASAFESVSVYAYRMDTRYCVITNCSDSMDCANARAAVKGCQKAKQRRSRAKAEAERQKNLKQHPGSQDVARKIEDANAAVNPH